MLVVFKLTFAPTVTLLTATLLPTKFHKLEVLPKLKLLVSGLISPVELNVPVYDNDPTTTKLPPIAKLPEIFALPVTVNAASGDVFLMPTRLLTESTNKTPPSKLTFEVTFPEIETFPATVKLSARATFPVIFAVPATFNLSAREVVLGPITKFPLPTKRPISLSAYIPSV
jgi:hypothetical protein